MIRADLFSEDTLEFTKILNEHAVRYVIVGGIAVIYHGYSRGTGDVDIFYNDDDENVQKLYESLKLFWEGDIPAVDQPADLQRDETIIQFGRPPYRIDLMNSIDGVIFQEVYSEAIEEEIELDPPVSVKIINRSHLLQNKRASDRPLDQQDVRYLTGEE